MSGVGGIVALGLGDALQQDVVLALAFVVVGFINGDDDDDDTAMDNKDEMEDTGCCC